MYLHADGGIGASGSIDGIDVQVEVSLARYILPNPPTGKDLIDALKKSMGFLDVAPRAITVPLYAAIWRAALAEGDLSIHLAGPTGQGKSAIAALAQQHFGATMEARYLPANWTGSANALEALTFTAKDALLVIDEFTPTDARHAQDLQRAAERIFRAQANRTGRQRMRADTTLRPPKPPRGFIISTGEDSPKGQSLQARMLLIDVEPNAVDFEKLTICQKDALDASYAQALAAFVQWLAPHYTEIQAHLQDEIAELRQAAARSDQHRRTAGNTASLALGWRYFLIFAWKTGALSEAEAHDQWQRAWNTLLLLAGIQAQHQQEAEPTQRFLDLLQDAIASGRAYLQKVVANGKSTYTSQRIGSNDESEYKGERIGWIDAAHVYLLPDVSYAMAKRLGTEAGNELTVTAPTLRKRLKEKGLIAEIESSRTTLVVRKQIDGERHRVLVIYTTALSTGKKCDQHDNAALNPDEWSLSCPPLVTNWSPFLSQSDSNSILNNKDLSESGHVGHNFPARESLSVNSAPFCGHIAPNQSDQCNTESDQCDHFSPISSLIEEEQTCPNCGTTMDVVEKKKTEDPDYRCSECGKQEWT